ncbi:MAG TPA: helix-turn-helix transcriptional regulator [Verrucomicrobiae bacterium]
MLGDRIRATRKERGLSQENLALEANLDRSFVGQVERGERNVSFLTLCAIAFVIETDVGTLTEGLPQKHERAVP